MLVDTHCHLDFLDNPKEKIAAAQKKQISQIITPGVNADSSNKCVQLAKKYPGIFAAVGLHPIDVTSQNKSIKKQLQFIEELLQKEKDQIVAIGETGLDFGPPPEGEKTRPQNDQISLFQSHIQLAKRYHLPLIIHNRKAGTQLLESLQSIKAPIHGVLHCFTGSKQFLNQVLEMGFYIGVTGLITYDRGLQEVIKTAPLDRILLETDSPYLVPEPLRRTRRWPNEPKNVTMVAEKVAELRGDSFVSVAKQTTINAWRLFKVT